MTSTFLGPSRPTPSSSARTTLIINNIILSQAIAVLMYVGIEMFLVSLPGSPFCSIYHRIKIVTYSIALYTAYFALWFRIYKVFYNNKVVQQKLGKFQQYLSYSAVPFLSIMIIASLAIFQSSPTYRNVSCGCMRAQNTESTRLKWVILLVWITIVQVVLLFTFIYPLRMHRKNMVARGINQTNVISVVKRAATVTGVCVFTDLLNTAFAATYPGQTVYLNHVVYSCNLLVNLAATILTFTTWRKILFPFGKEHDIALAYSVRETRVTIKRDSHLSRNK